MSEDLIEAMNFLDILKIEILGPIRYEKMLFAFILF